MGLHACQHAEQHGDERRGGKALRDMPHPSMDAEINKERKAKWTH
jgi:hypothetical protein